MSQQQGFGAGGPPGSPNIEFVEGNDAVLVGPNPVNHAIQILGGPGVDVTNTAPYQETITLANQVVGIVTTVGVQVENCISFTPPLTVAARGIYRLFFTLLAWDNGDTLGAAYDIIGTITSDGTIFHNVGQPTIEQDGDNTVFNTDLVDVTFLAGTIFLQVTGVSGKTIKWTGTLNYFFGGA